jgi:hypothetical protein
MRTSSAARIAAISAAKTPVTAIVLGTRQPSSRRTTGLSTQAKTAANKNVRRTPLNCRTNTNKSRAPRAMRMYCK